MQTAKVFICGRSQAVRIPREYRFDAEEVFINRVGDAIILTPVNSVREVYRSGVNGFSGDFLQEGRPDQLPTQREGL